MSQGLDRVDALGVGHGWAEAGASLNPFSGDWGAFAEAGIKESFGDIFARADARPDFVGAAVGVRW